MSPGESYGQLDPIWNSQLITRYKEMSPHESYGQLDPIWNSQLIGRYKEMSLGEYYIWNCQSTEWTLRFSIQSMRAHLKQSTNRKISRNVTKWILRYNPPFETGRAQSELFTFQCGQWELIWNSQLIGRYQEMSPGESYIWNCQSTEWTLRFSIQSMRAHLKQSTHRKI